MIMIELIALYRKEGMCVFDVTDMLSSIQCQGCKLFSTLFIKFHIKYVWIIETGSSKTSERINSFKKKVMDKIRNNMVLL